MNSLRLQIVTPEGRVFDNDVLFVELPTLEGRLGIYPGHIGLVAGLAAGEIRVQTAEALRSFVVIGGHVKIGSLLMTVLAFFATPEEEKIEEACRRARAALEQAQSLPPEQVEDDVAWLRIEMERGKKKMKPVRPTGGATGKS